MQTVPPNVEMLCAKETAAEPYRSKCGKETKNPFVRPEFYAVQRRVVRTVVPAQCKLRRNHALKDASHRPRKHAGNKNILRDRYSFLLRRSNRDNATMKKRSKKTESGV